MKGGEGGGRGKNTRKRKRNTRTFQSPMCLGWVPEEEETCSFAKRTRTNKQTDRHKRADDNQEEKRKNKEGGVTDYLRSGVRKKRENRHFATKRFVLFHNKTGQKKHPEKQARPDGRTRKHKPKCIGGAGKGNHWKIEKIFGFLRSFFRNSGKRLSSLQLQKRAKFYFIFYFFFFCLLCEPVQKGKEEISFFRALSSSQKQTRRKKGREERWSLGWSISPPLVRSLVGSQRSKHENRTTAIANHHFGASMFFIVFLFFLDKLHGTIPPFFFFRNTPRGPL